MAADMSENLVTRLADCIMQHTREEDLEFLVKQELPNKGYKGKRRAGR